MPRTPRFDGGSSTVEDQPSSQAPSPPMDMDASLATQAPPPPIDASLATQAPPPPIDASLATQAPPPPIDASLSTQAPPPPIDASLATQAPPPSTDAPPSTQDSLAFADANPSIEAPSEALPAAQTWNQRRQRTKAPLQASTPSTDGQAPTQTPPPFTSDPSSLQAPSPSINGSLSTLATSPPVIRTRLQRRQYMEALSQARPLSVDDSPSIQTPPLSVDGSPSFQTPPPTLIDATLTFMDATPSMEAPSEAPTATQTQYRGRQSTRYWTVEVKDASGVTKEAHLKLKDLWELPDGTKVVLPLNECKQPVGEAAGLLGQALGQLGANFVALPICYKSWAKVPDSYKEEIYNSKIKEKFIINSEIVKKIIIKRIGEKWKENRSDVFHKYYDSKLSREENYANHPPGTTQDQWIQFIEYRLDPKTVEMCERNAQSREKLVVLHRGGSKTLARKRHEMELESGELVGRGKVFVATHAKADGSYGNEATQTICEKIIHVESEGSCSQAIAPNDSLGQVFGKEPPGRIRGLGLGPSSTQLFGTQNEMHEEGSCLKCAPFLQMQQEIVDLRAKLEREKKSRLEFEKSVALILQHVSTPYMTPELAAILTPLITRALQDTRASNEEDDGPSN